MNIFDFLPLELWKNALLHPKETFAKEKANASLVNGTKQVVAGGVVNWFIFEFLRLLIRSNCHFLGCFPYQYGNENSIRIYAYNLSFSEIGSMLGAILAPIGLFVGTGILWILAKRLGGKGSFSAQYYVATLYAAPLIAVSNIPFVGLFAWFYGIYLTVLAIREVHKFNTTKAIIVVAILAVIVIGIAILLVLVAIGMILAFLLLLGSAGVGNYAMLPAVHGT